MAAQIYKHYLYGTCNDDRFRWFIELREVVSDNNPNDMFNAYLLLNLENISNESVTLDTTVNVSGLWKNDIHSTKISGTLNPGQSTLVVRIDYPNQKYNSIGEYTFVFNHIKYGIYKMVKPVLDIGGDSMKKD